MTHTTFSRVQEYEGQSKISLSYSTNAENLDELLEALENFILASGYRPKGKLEFVEEDEPPKDRHWIGDPLGQFDL